MIDINKPKNYVEDLRDDIYANYEEDLYGFIKGDVERAFWTAFLLTEMFEHEDLELEQYLLYSKQLRHVNDVSVNYSSQVGFWEKQYLQYSCNPKMTDITNYILNNLICINDSDILDIAMTFGKSFYTEENKVKNNDNKESKRNNKGNS